MKNEKKTQRMKTRREKKIRVSFTTRIYVVAQFIYTGA